MSFSDLMQMRKLTQSCSQQIMSYEEQDLCDYYQPVPTEASLSQIADR